MLNKLKKIINIETLLLSLVSFALSSWLMFSTFSYKDGSMLIASKAWSDFASTIPLIRSFSLGNNFPPEFPIFSGEPIRYHFLFYALVGILEKIGLRSDFALNIPSALSFAGLLTIIYFLAKNLFKNRAVAILSIVFFVFNGSLSFLEFFKNHPLSINTIQDIIANATFPSFGPYDGKAVSAFWNLNIYTNQRHLALPLTILLFLVLLFLKYEQKNKAFPKHLIIFSGIITGILPFSHSSVFIMAVAIFSAFFLFFPNYRKSVFFILLIGVLLSLPRVLFLGGMATFTPHVNPRYLIPNELTFLNFLTYWFLNLGLSLILIPVGVALSSKLQRKIFLAFLSLFLIGHLIQFSPEIAATHKFFNVFLIVGNMFAGYALVKLWKFQIITRVFVPFLFFLMIFSGIIDFFPIKNDRFIILTDYPKNPDVKWIMDNTPRNSVFLNTQYLYDTASLAGRKIFLGWPYFSWSLGYDTYTRDNLRKNLFNPPSLGFFCEEARKYHLDYVSIEPSTDTDFKVNRAFFDRNFLNTYKNPQNGFTIYNTKLTCLKYVQ